MSEPSLREHASSGVRLIGAATLAGQLLTAGQLLVVGKFVPPEDIGAYLLALTLVGIVTPLGDLGLGRALVYQHSSHREGGPRIAKIVLMSGSMVALGVVALAPLVARATQQPGIELPLRMLAVMVPLAALADVAAATREVGLEFRRIASADLAASFTGSFVTMGLVILGLDLEALVWGVVATAAIRLAMLVKIRTSSQRAEEYDLRSALEFGVPHSAQRVLNTAASSLDYVIVGLFVVDTELGLYAFAYLLATVATTRVNAITGRVMFPVLTHATANANRLRRGFLEMHRLICTIALPIGVGLALASTSLEALFGTAWEGFGTVLVLLAVVGITRGVAGTVGPLLLAMGRTRRGALWSVGVLVWQIPIIVIGASSWGITGAAGGYAFAQVVVVVANYRLMIRQLLGDVLRPYITSLGPPLAATVVMAITTVPVAIGLRDARAGVALACIACVGAASYVVSLVRIDRSIVGSIAALAKGKILR